MVGIRFHGRGGQGAVVASKILAHAYFEQGLYVQAFPSFGMERKGAAVSAFVRLDSIPIVERGEIKNPSAIIVLDSSLLRKVDIVQGAKPDALHKGFLSGRRGGRRQNSSSTRVGLEDGSGY
jgi:2-oxoacid:acceptor oxidoreductase gamma subunit (pyruvate/2-ketoisovalerate family)